MFSEGQQIGLYTLIRKLGRGGFGEVWLAERKSKFVTTKVAVKLPIDEQVDHEAIKQEATLWEQASGHPNVLPIIDADEYDGQILIVSEYAPDGSLEQWLRQHGIMPVEKAVETAIEILEGLEFLHSRNIIHRDLKPANILLQGNIPRLADFGISRALRTTVSSQSSNVSGTFAYMPPEGFDGKRSIQTDIWAVGVNLYQFLTGSLPFPQKEPSTLIAAIMMKDFEPLPEEIPLNLKNIITKALAKSPENRYQTAREMRDDLRHFLRYEIDSNLTLSNSQKPFTNSEPVQSETETIVRPITTSESEHEEQLTGTVWKLGCNWGGRQNPSFYSFIKNEGIAIGIERLRYSKGDLLLIADGFTIKAIAKIQEEPKQLTRNSAYNALFDHYRVEEEHNPIYAKAEWYELNPSEVFQYKMQRGGCKVNQPEIKEKATELWSQREHKNSVKEINLPSSEDKNNSPIISSNRPLTPNQKQKLDSWKYEKTLRRQDEHPILETEPVSERRRNEWTSSDYVREITFQITGKHTFHAQENMELLREFLNKSINDENKVLRRSAMQLGKGIFENYKGLFYFDFQSKEHPTKEKFLNEINNFLYADSGLAPTQKSHPIEQIQPTIKSFPAKQIQQKPKDNKVLTPKTPAKKEVAFPTLGLEQNKKRKAINNWMIATIVLFVVFAVIFVSLVKQNAPRDLPQLSESQTTVRQSSSNSVIVNSLNQTPSPAVIIVEFKALSEPIALTYWLDEEMMNKTVISGESLVLYPQNSVKIRYYRGFTPDKIQLTINGKKVRTPNASQKGVAIEFEINRNNFQQIIQSGKIQ